MNNVSQIITTSINEKSPMKSSYKSINENTSMNEIIDRAFQIKKEIITTSKINEKSPMKKFITPVKTPINAATNEINKLVLQYLNPEKNSEIEKYVLNEILAKINIRKDVNLTKTIAHQTKFISQYDLTNKCKNENKFSPFLFIPLGHRKYFAFHTRPWAYRHIYKSGTTSINR
eukprot:UN03118